MKPKEFQTDWIHFSPPGRRTEPCSNSKFRLSIPSQDSPEDQVPAMSPQSTRQITSNIQLRSFPRDQGLDWWLVQARTVRPREECCNLRTERKHPQSESLLLQPGPGIHWTWQGRDWQTHKEVVVIITRK